MYSNEQYLRKAVKLHKLTGKSLRTCYFCVAYYHGDYQKAVKMCDQSEGSEGGR